MVEHKVVLHAAIIALWTIVTLLIEVICLPLKWRYMYISDKNYAIVAAMLQMRRYLVKEVSSWSPWLEFSYGKIFILVTK